MKENKTIDKNNNYVDVIKALFTKKGQEIVDNKLNKLFKEKSGEEITIIDLLTALGEPSFDFYDLYQNGAKKLVYQGLIIEEKDDDEYRYYGEVINNTGIEVFAELIEQINSKYTDNLIDDFLLNFDSKDKKPLHLIIKLLIFTMNNYFDSTYDKLLIDGKGIIDYKINLLTKHKSLFQSVPVNDFIYGLFVDGLHTEKQFDKYLNKGSYQLLCEEMDRLFNNSNDIIDNTIIKQQLILIGNMFNNKLFYLTHYGIISQQLRNKLIERFNLIFNKVLQAFEITFLEEDFIKIEEAMNNSIARLNKSNKERLS